MQKFGVDINSFTDNVLPAKFNGTFIGVGNFSEDRSIKVPLGGANQGVDQSPSEFFWFANCGDEDSKPNLNVSFTFQGATLFFAGENLPVTSFVLPWGEAVMLTHETSPSKTITGLRLGSMGDAPLADGGKPGLISLPSTPDARHPIYMKRPGEPSIDAATAEIPGVVIVPENGFLHMRQNGEIYVDEASFDKHGVVQPDRISMYMDPLNDGKFIIGPKSYSKANPDGDWIPGTVTPADGFDFDPDMPFKISVRVAHPEDKAATGTVKVGENIALAEDGTISIPVAGATVHGVVEQGPFITTDGAGKLSYKQDVQFEIQDIRIDKVAGKSSLTIEESPATSPVASKTLDYKSVYAQFGGQEYGTGSYRLIGLGYRLDATTSPPAFIGYQETYSNQNTVGDIIIGGKVEKTTAGPLKIWARFTSDGDIKAEDPAYTPINPNSFANKGYVDDSHTHVISAEVNTLNTKAHKGICFCTFHQPGKRRIMYLPANPSVNETYRVAAVGAVSGASPFEAGVRIEATGGKVIKYAGGSSNIVEILSNNLGLFTYDGTDWYACVLAGSTTFPPLNGIGDVDAPYTTDDITDTITP